MRVKITQFKKNQLATLYEAEVTKLEAKFETELVLRHGAELRAAAAEAKLQNLPS